MKMNPTDKGFLQMVFGDLIKTHPTMAALPPKALACVELGFIFGAVTLSGVMGEFSRKMPDLSKHAQKMIHDEGETMLSRLKEQIKKEVGGAPTPNTSGFPLDKEFKL